MKLRVSLQKVRSHLTRLACQNETSPQCSFQPISREPQASHSATSPQHSRGSQNDHGLETEKICTLEVALVLQGVPLSPSTCAVVQEQAANLDCLYRGHDHHINTILIPPHHNHQSHRLQAGGRWYNDLLNTSDLVQQTHSHDEPSDIGA